MFCVLTMPVISTVLSIAHVPLYSSGFLWIKPVINSITQSLLRIYHVYSNINMEISTEKNVAELARGKASDKLPYNSYRGLSQWTSLSLEIPCQYFLQSPWQPKFIMFYLMHVSLSSSFLYRIPCCTHNPHMSYEFFSIIVIWIRCNIWATVSPHEHLIYS